MGRRTQAVPAVARRGDLWRLGEHLVLCADAGAPSAARRLMAGNPASLLITSPPYAAQRQYGGPPRGGWDGLMRRVFRAARPALAPDAQLLVNLGLVHRAGEWQPYWSGWLDWMRCQGWRRFGLYAWDQGPGLPGDWNGRLAPAFELVFHFNRVARRPNKIVPCKWAGTPNKGTGLRAADGAVKAYTHIGLPVQPYRIPDSVIRVTRHKGRGIEVGHPAVFPVALPEFLISAYTNPGDLVFDPFGGAGSTLLAAERIGRRARLLELEPRYVDIILARWAARAVGVEAVRDRDGAGYAALAASAAARDGLVGRPDAGDKASGGL
jgi:DNA modification methylase